MQFHLLSFTNDLWQLDPRRDYLIMMYPQGFFRDATIAIGGLTLALAMLCWWGGTALQDRLYPRPKPARVDRSGSSPDGTEEGAMTDPSEYKPEEETSSR